MTIQSITPAPVPITIPPEVPLEIIDAIERAASILERAIFVPTLLVCLVLGFPVSSKNGPVDASLQIHVKSREFFGGNVTPSGAELALYRDIYELIFHGAGVCAISLFVSVVSVDKISRIAISVGVGCDRILKWRLHHLHAFRVHSHLAAFFGQDDEVVWLAEAAFKVVRQALRGEEIAVFLGALATRPMRQQLSKLIGFEFPLCRFCERDLIEVSRRSSP